MTGLKRGDLTRFIRSIAVPRLPAVASAVLVLGLGLGSRYGLTGFWAKYLGVCFWATLVYVLAVLVKPSVTASRAALISITISWFVEFAQLTPVPAWLSSKHIILRLIFGTTFNPGDLLATAVGVGLAAGVHALARRRRS